MPNPLITLNDPLTIAEDLTSLITPNENVYFVVLGNTAAAYHLATHAVQYAVDWRHVLHITVATHLNYLPLAPDIPPTDKNGVWKSLGISFDGIIVAINNQNDLSDVVPTFMLSESYNPAL